MYLSSIQTAASRRHTQTISFPAIARPARTQPSATLSRAELRRIVADLLG